MNRESLVFGISGVFFGLLVGWIIGSHHATNPRTATALTDQASQQEPTAGQAASAAPPVLDDGRVESLRAAAGHDRNDPRPRAELGNLYFDAERYEDAIRWYEESLKLDPRNVNVSTDLGVSYYYSNEPDRALKQFDHSLSIDPDHAKTILNLGIVKAFGKQDLEGATAAWERVVRLAPDSPEGRAARQALDSMRSAHPGLAATPSPRGSD